MGAPPPAHLRQRRRPPPLLLLASLLLGAALLQLGCAARLGSAGPASAATVVPLRRRPLQPSAVGAVVDAGRRRLAALAGEGVHSNSSGGRRLLEEASVEQQLNSASWGQGVYTAAITLGTPPQEFEVVADTGSVLLFVPCSGCSDTLCGTHIHSPLDVSASSTYRPISCLSFQCLTGMCASGSCVYYDEYADGSTSQGTLVADALGVGGLGARVIFGCENAASGNVWVEPSDGIMGLGLGQISVVSQLVDAQAMADQFAVCLGPIGPEYTVANPVASLTGSENGALVLGSLAGADAADDTQWTPLVRSLVCWTSYLVELQGVAVDGVDIGRWVNASADEMAQNYAEGCGAVVLDSGSTFMYVDTLALEALTAGVIAGLRGGAAAAPCPSVMLDTPGSNGTNVTCFTSRAYSIAAARDYFPTVTLSFPGVTLELGPENYLFALGPYWPGVYVLGVYDSFGRGTVLGAIALSGNLVVFDRSAMRVGFRNGTDCDAFGRSGALVAPGPGGPPRPLARPLRWLMAPGALQMMLLFGCLVWAVSSCCCC